MNQRLKIKKDFSFLLVEKGFRITDKIIKYVLKEGNEEKLSQMEHQFEATYSITSYDYYGNIVKHQTLHKLQIKSAKKDKEEGLFFDLLITMANKEEAWFNVEDTCSDVESLQEQRKPKRTGTHHHIKLIKVQFFHDSHSMASKIHMFQQNRQKGKNFFNRKEYQAALKQYKFSINITQGFSRKLFSKQQIEQLQQMNVRAKLNYLRCFLKIEISHLDFEDLEKMTKEYREELMRRKQQDPSVIFIEAKLLHKEGLLSASLDMAKKTLQLKNSSEVIDFINQVKEDIKNKGKKKVLIE